MGDWTKGPWIVEPTRAVAGGVTMYWINSNTSVGTTNEADARLVGAALDLVEALKEAVEEIEDLRNYANSHGVMIDDIACDYGRAALAKAGAA